MEYFVLHESVSLLEDSYWLSATSLLKAFGCPELEVALQSYLFILGQGTTADLTDQLHHHSLRAYLIENPTDSWLNLA